MVISPPPARDPAGARELGAPSVALGGFEPLLTGQRIPQRRLLAYTAWLMTTARCASEGLTAPADLRRVWEETRDRVKRYGVGPEHIQARVLLMVPQALAQVEPSALGGQLPELFADLHRDPDGAPVDARMAHYARVAAEVLDQAYPPAAEAPDDIVHVTCSGYMAPNPVERHVARRGWGRTAVTNSYHMGCYGAFPAVRIAAGLLTSAALGLSPPKRRVDILHTEPLSLHADLADHSPGNVVTATLFGDGFVRYQATSGGSVPAGGGLWLHRWEERILPGSSDEMTWDLSPHGFKMYLSPEVPLFIRDHVAGLVDSLALAAGMRPATLRARAHFAVHPGGPRIVDRVAEVLDLIPAQVRHSRQVLFDLGNMSSATVPHIWGRVVADTDIPAGTPVVSLAFGPGLTATALLAQKV